jgi:hypothetical protein
MNRIEIELASEQGSELFGPLEQLDADLLSVPAWRT